jgi:hypothetical protein
MSPGKGMRGVAYSTRHARSPLMTYVYSVFFWVGMAIIIVVIAIRNLRT